MLISYVIPRYYSRRRSEDCKLKKAETQRTKNVLRKTSQKCHHPHKLLKTCLGVILFTLKNAQKHRGSGGNGALG